MCLVFQRCVTYKGQEYHSVEKCNNDNEGGVDDGVCLVFQRYVTYKGQEYHSVEKCNNDNEFSSSSGVYVQGPGVPQC